MATYCRPTETAAALARLAADPVGTRMQTARARDTAMRRYSTDAMETRLDALRNVQGDAQRQAVSASPMRVVRKLGGLYRRRVAGAGE